MLTLRYLPHHEIEALDSEERIKKILDIVKKDKIVLLEGKLREQEEASLIAETMKSINKSFKGIEIATIESQSEVSFFKNFVLKTFMKNRSGLTIIGPASLVKEIKKDPKKIELLTEESTRKKKSKKGVSE